jgi:methyl-galactoside transport system permease protein
MNAKKAQTFITQNAIYIVLVLLIAGIALYEPAFISVNTLRDIMIQSSTRIIIALGVAFILITAGTDLSAGRVVGFTAGSVYAADSGLFPPFSQICQVKYLPILIAI